MVIAIIFSALLGVAHYISDKIDIERTPHKMRMVSFTAGIFITYLFLNLFPHLYLDSEYLTRLALVFVLAGFSIFHVIEKYLYKHASKDRLRKDLREIHAIMFFIYHFVIGVILVSITATGFIQGALLFIPIFSFSVVSSISVKEIHNVVRENRAMKFLLSISTPLGASLAMLFPLPTILYYGLLGFIAGTLLYVIITESLPREKMGEPLFFVLGVFLYTILIGLTWVV